MHAIPPQLNCSHRVPIATSHTALTPLSCTHRRVPRLTRHAGGAVAATAAAAAAAKPQQANNASSYATSALQEQQHQHSECCSQSSSSSWWSRLDWELLLLVSALPPVPCALAEDGLKYDSSRGEGIVKTLSGGLYIGLLLYFLFRVLNRRARKAREERLAGQGPVRTIFTTWIEKATEGKERPQATPAAAFFGAVQAGLIGFGLFVFASKVEGLVYSSDLPNGYTARNIAVTVRTIIVGLMYLATFTFSANALGLAGLGVQLLLFPDSLPDDGPRAGSRLPKEPALPKVTVTSSPEEIKAAFAAVARAQNGGSSSGGGERPLAGVSGGAGGASSSSSSSTSSSDGEGEK